MHRRLHRLAFWALVAFAFSLPWERNVAVPAFGAAATPLGIVALLLGVASIIERGKMKLRPPAIFLAVLAIFVLWSGATYFWSINPQVTLGRTVSYAQLLLMAWLIWQLVRNQADQASMMRAYVLGAFFAIGIVLLSYFHGDAYRVGLSGLRFSFGGGDPNYLALGLALAIPMAWRLYLTEKAQALQALNLLFIPCALITIGLTGSRGGMLSAAVALSVIPITYWHLDPMRKVVLVGALAATVYAAFAVIPVATMERLFRTPQDIAEEQLAGRQNIWRAGVALLTEQETTLLIGTGTGTFSHAVEDTYGRRVAGHNAYLDVLVGSGIVGLALFLTIFGLAIAPNLCGDLRSRAVSLTLWLTLAIGIFSLSWEREKPLWFALALLATQRTVVVTIAGRPLDSAYSEPAGAAAASRVPSLGSARN